MPLIKSVLESKLTSRIKTLETKLYNALRKKSTGLYKAQMLVDAKVTDTSPSSGFDIASFKNTLWETNANEWSKVIAKEVINLLSDDVSKIIAEEVTSYIKTASIITPPGQVVTVGTPSGPGTGSTTTPSSPNTIT